MTDKPSLSSSSSTSKANDDIDDKNNDNKIPIVSPPPHPPGHRGGGLKSKNSSSSSSAATEGKPVRRVSFSEFPIQHYDDQSPHKRSSCCRRSSSSNSGGRGGGCGGGDGRRCCSSCCCLCCIWLSIILVCLFLFVALAIALFFVYFQPKLPVVRLERLNITMLNVTTSNQQDYLSTDIELLIAVSNVNQRIEFLYSPFTVYVSSGMVNLGKANIPGFTQLGVNNMTVLRVHTGVSHALVDNEEGERLRAGYGYSRLLGNDIINNNSESDEDEEMDVDVVLSGTVRFIFYGDRDGNGGLKTAKLPIGVICKNVDVSKVALGNYNDHEPQCKVELFYLQQEVTTNNNNQPNVF